jgi:hypothetical protein
VVFSPASGDATTRADRNPSSAGEFQVCPAAAGAFELSGLPLRRNQSDSRESKIGSRWSAVAPAVGGTVTVLPSEPPRPEATELAGGDDGIVPVPADPPSPPSAGIRVVANSPSPNVSLPKALPPAGPPAVPPLDAPGPSGW